MFHFQTKRKKDQWKNSNFFEKLQFLIDDLLDERYFGSDSLELSFPSFPQVFQNKWHRILIKLSPSDRRQQFTRTFSLIPIDFWLFTYLKSIQNIVFLFHFLQTYRTLCRWCNANKEFTLIILTPHRALISDVSFSFSASIFATRISFN